MKVKKINLFAPMHNQYGVIDYFTQHLCEALSIQGIEATIMKSDHNDPKSFLDELINNPPDCTLSFNGLLPDNQGRFLCDLIKIPHFAFLTDAPKHFFPLVGSKMNIIGCIDQDFCQTFTSINFPNVLFLPHAVSKDLTPLTSPEYLYDVAMFNSYIDYESIRNDWMKNYEKGLGTVLDEAAEKVLSDRSETFMNAYFTALDKYVKSGKIKEPGSINHIEVLDALEAYIGGKSRVDLLKSIEDVPVHVFGSQKGMKDWEKYLGKHKNIIVHECVPFEEALDLMKRTKIILNTTPEIKRGLHERILSGMACGTAVLALDTPYLSEIFKDKESILLYSPQDWKDVNAKLKTYLDDEGLRKAVVKKSREIVMRDHTWDQRAKTLLKALPNFLDK